MKIPFAYAMYDYYMKTATTKPARPEDSDEHLLGRLWFGERAVSIQLYKPVAEWTVPSIVVKTRINPLDISYDVVANVLEKEIMNHLRLRDSPLQFGRVEVVPRLYKKIFLLEAVVSEKTFD